MASYIPKWLLMLEVACGSMFHAYLLTRRVTQLLVGRTVPA